jgi:plastocyanin
MVLAVALLTTACGGEAEPGPAATTAGGPAGTGGPAPSGPPAPSAATPAADVAEIRVTVTGGRVSPRPSVHKVRLGQTVRLTVTVDEADEVHIHGYDRELKVAAGKPATVEFRADRSGRFEVETHESELQLLQLQVS